jgi:CubicO group peptidase (beta-lactamase class C family)
VGLPAAPARAVEFLRRFAAALVLSGAARAVGARSFLAIVFENPATEVPMKRLSSVGWIVVIASSLLAARYATAQNLSVAAQTPGKKPTKPDTNKPPADGSVCVGDTGAILEKYMASEKLFPGGFSGTVLVAKEGTPIFVKGYGLADADSKKTIRADALWDWCSVTKQFTAAAVLKLEMLKKLSIDDSITKHFPKAPADKAPVTLRHLLNHTSGIEGGKFEGVNPFDREAVVKHILEQKVANPPGSKWEYSNQAYFLLAALIEKIAGQPYEKFLKDQLFVPAGMKSTTCIGEPDLDEKRVPRDDLGKGATFAYGSRMSWGYRGAGGVVAPVADMLLWDKALRADKVLNKAEKEKYYTVGLQNYALGWEVKKVGQQTQLSHSGHTGKVVTFYLREIETQIVVAYATNTDPPTHPQIVCNSLAAIARTGTAPPGFER